MPVQDDVVYPDISREDSSTCYGKRVEVNYQEPFVEGGSTYRRGSSVGGSAR